MLSLTCEMVLTEFIFRLLSKYRNAMDKLFKDLNDPTRLSILEHLLQKDVTVADGLTVSKLTISHQVGTDINGMARLV